MKDLHRIPTEIMISLPPLSRFISQIIEDNVLPKYGGSQ